MIRPAKTSDLLQIRQLLHSAVTIGEAPRSGDAAFDPRAAQAAGRIHVAFDHTVIAGFVVFWEDGMDLHIQRFVVNPKYRRRGTAQELLTHLDTIALSDHCLRILVHAPAADFAVMSFCRARGFREIDQRRHGGEEVHYLERALR